MKNAETSSIVQLIKDGKTFIHSVEKPHILAEMFSKNSSLHESDQPLPFMPQISSTMREVHIRTRELKRVLTKLDIKKSSALDDIPARVLLMKILRHWPNRFAICSTFRLNRVNFLHVG